MPRTGGVLTTPCFGPCRRGLDGRDGAPAAGRPILGGAMSMRKPDAARGIHARQFIATSAQCACAALFALILLSSGAAKADLILPLAAFQADVFSGAEAKVVCGAPGPNCGGPLGTNETTTPQVAQLDTLLASTNPGPQIESLTTIASGTSTTAVLSGGRAQAETKFY